MNLLLRWTDQHLSVQQFGAVAQTLLPWGDREENTDWNQAEGVRELKLTDPHTELEAMSKVRGRGLREDKEKVKWDNWAGD